MTQLVEPGPVPIGAEEHPAPLPPVPFTTPSPRVPGWLPTASTIVAIVGVIAVVLWQMHLNLLLTNTTTTGGDTGSHFVMPAFIKAHLLPSLRLTGWDPSWYAGYPIYTFYFVIPDLLAALASYLIPYGIAFKLMTVLGSLLMPVGAWACGRLFRLRQPGPAALAVATLPFLFDYTWTIYGGNLFSTLAGEYAYSLAIPLALAFLGLFARGLRTGRGRGWSAVVLALCILCHVVVALLALAGAVVLIGLELTGDLVRDDDGVARVRTDRWRRQALWWGGATLGLGVLLCAWWLVPFLLDHAYSTQMGYTNVTTYRSLLFPGADLWALYTALVAVVVAVVTRSRFGILLSLLGGLSALGVVVCPQSALYNTRILPLWFLCVYLMVGWLASWIVRLAALWWRDRQDWLDTLHTPPILRLRRFEPAAILGPLVVLVGALTVVIPPFFLPASLLPVTPGPNQVINWSAWNYQGYEGAPAHAEFYALMDTMTRVGKEHGCGRAMWEYNANQDRFGTPEALMDLAYFTGGCIDSMEGLLFESSTTTPFHFANQSELSVAPSDPFVNTNDVYGPLYSSVDVPLGIEHLQLLGVRYFMAFSPQVVDAAKADPDLHLVATTGPWRTDYGGVYSTTWDIFRIGNSAPVAPLYDLPAVLTNVSAGQGSWLKPAVDWYQDPAEWDVELAAGGPANWQRVKAGQKPRTVPITPAKVTDIQEGTDTISFHVNRPGAPVLVKTSYFPNWVAHGAQGPWRVTPNLMVVLPTSRTVTLTYGIGTAGKLGDALTGVGIVILAAGAIAAWRRRRAAPARTGPPEGPETTSAPIPSSPDVAFPAS